MGKQFKKSLSSHKRHSLTKTKIDLKKSTYSSLSKLKPKENKKTSQKELKFKFALNLSGNNKEMAFSKKMKLKPLKSLFIEINESIDNMIINHLKKFADKFDINPDINFKLLSYLEKSSPKEYKKYIDKYKYTLKFKDALELKCFDKKEILQAMDEFNQNITHFKLGIPKIKSKKNIISFSKIKLFNLLLFLQSKDIIQFEYKEILKKIMSYCIPQTMIFKVPNKFANIELLYYYYTKIFVDLLIPDNISSHKKGVFFNFKIETKPEKEEIDLNNFFARKKSLENYIKEVDIEKQNIEKKTQKKKKEEEKEEDILAYKINIFQAFGENIKEIIKLKDENQIIQRIKFLSYLILFLGKN